MGIDLNRHGVAVANMGRDGSPEQWSAGLAAEDRTSGSLHKHAGELSVGVAPGRIGLHAPELW